jgi:hypothetical protein
VLAKPAGAMWLPLRDSEAFIRLPKKLPAMRNFWILPLPFREVRIDHGMLSVSLGGLCLKCSYAQSAGAVKIFALAFFINWRLLSLRYGSFRMIDICPGDISSSSLRLPRVHGTLTLLFIDPITKF